MNASPPEATYSITGVQAATAPGDYSLTATATGNYSGSQTFAWKINRMDAPTSWQSIAPITYGTPLSSQQLNATADVAGTFSYSPAAGTIIPVGDNQTLTAIFSPVDTANFAKTTVTNTIAVSPAPQAPLTLLPGSESVPLGSKVFFTAVGGSGTGGFVWDPPPGTFLASNGGPKASASFPYPGVVTVTVYRQADSNHAGNSNTASSTITIVDPPPAATATGR